MCDFDFAVHEPRPLLLVEFHDLVPVHIAEVRLDGQAFSVFRAKSQQRTGGSVCVQNGPFCAQNDDPLLNRVEDGLHQPLLTRKAEEVGRPGSIRSSLSISLSRNPDFMDAAHWRSLHPEA